MVSIRGLWICHEGLWYRSYMYICRVGKVKTTSCFILGQERIGFKFGPLGKVY